MVSPSLSLLVLKTRQVENLLKFYGSLGVGFSTERHISGPLHHAAHVGGVVFEVYPLPEDGGSPDTTTRLGFAVADLSEVVGSLEAIGMVVAKPQATEWGLRAVVRDPDGRAVELVQRQGGRMG